MTEQERFAECSDCGAVVVGALNGFCVRCAFLHREFCACLGTNLGDGCDLDRGELTEVDLDRAYHDSFRWPVEAAR